METKKEMSIEDLAKLMNDGFEESAKQTDEKIEKSAKQTDEKIENLARITQNGFSRMDEKFNILSSDVAELKTTVNKLERTIIQKADKVDLNTLDYRMEKLEEKFA